MKIYVKFMRRFFLPLLAIAVIALIYFGVNGVKAEFTTNQNQERPKGDLANRSLNIVSADTGGTQNVASPVPNITPVPQNTEVEPTPEVENIVAPAPETPKEKVTLRISAGSAAGNYPVPYIAGETAYQLLIRVANAQAFSVNATDYGWGMFVEGIGNLNNTRDICWFFYINGKISEVGSSAYEVQPKDLIEWRYHEYWIY
jgi:hypothetical protein